MIEVRQATAADLERLVAREPDEARQLHERERFEAQERGEAALLVAWDGDEIRGRVRLRWFSKYAEIIDELGVFPEINALDAWPTGKGVGTTIIEACEEMARARGEQQMGIAVLSSNVDARRLYKRLGYEEWGEVVDDGDPAVYLVKQIT